jgi:hypothetical protein
MIYTPFDTCSVSIINLDIRSQVDVSPLPDTAIFLVGEPGASAATLAPTLNIEVQKLKKKRGPPENGGFSYWRPDEISAMAFRSLS